jgi:hypothetical protein
MGKFLNVGAKGSVSMGALVECNILADQELRLPGRKSSTREAKGLGHALCTVLWYSCSTGTGVTTGLTARQLGKSKGILPPNA